MMKSLVSSSLVVMLLCGPALAEVPAPTPPVSQPLDVTMVVNSGGQPRRYVMKLLDDSCGNVSSKNEKSEDVIQVCASHDLPIKLTIDWSTHDGRREFRNRSTVLARRGASFDVEGDGARLSVSMN